MASEVLGANKTKYDAGGSGDNYIGSKQYGGEVKCSYDTYEASGLATGSTISFTDLPDGARIVGVELAWDALGTSSTIALGDALDADRYIAATSSVAAGSSNTIRVDDALGYVIGTTATDEVPIATLTSSSSLNGTIKCAIFYV